MKYATLIWLMFHPFFTIGQQLDTVLIKSLYDRCLDFTEEKKDSLMQYAHLIAVQSEKHNFIKGNVLSLRLNGLYYDLENNYEKAVDYYLKSLEAAREINGTEYEIAALSDLAILYAHLNQPLKAKEVYLESARLSAKRGDASQLITAYTNLGAIYNQLNVTDSAMIYLNEGIRISKPLEKKQDLSALYNNLGNVYFKTGRYDEALQLFIRNKRKHAISRSAANLWIDYLNMADVFIEKKMYDSARWYAGASLQLALSLHAKSKESDSYNLLAKLYAGKGDFRKAYFYKQKWYAIDSALVNREVNQSIAGLQEKFKAREREHQNLLLSAAIEKEKLRSGGITFLAAAAGIIAFIIAIFFVQKRRANQKLMQVNNLITRQNERLAELDFEKNALISIVSHDLGSPFASIRMWGHVLQTDVENLNTSQRKAVERIITSTSHGEKLIHTILDVEKADAEPRVAKLENINVRKLVENVVRDFVPSALKKGVQLHFECIHPTVCLSSDAQYLHRICQNLISNAITCTPKKRNVFVTVTDKKSNIAIQVKDEGLGIAKEELPVLFSKYGKLSSGAINGGYATDPGLSTVKQLVEELNGEVFCKSTAGNGSLFTVVLNK